MKLMHLSMFIFTLTSLPFKLYGQCTPPVPSGWDETYCPEDIDRIEYQIPMNNLNLVGDTVNQIDSFLAWMIAKFQDSEEYSGIFRFREDEKKKYYRFVEQLSITKSGQDAIPPIVSSIKHRQSIDNFQHDGSEPKYQNDLTWEIAMTTPGVDVEYELIGVVAVYDPIWGTKLEPNIFVDTCIENYLSNANLLYGQETTSFSAKIEFDDDIVYGTNDDDAEDMVDTLLEWPNVQNNDDFSSICNEMDEFFVDFCTFYQDPIEVTKSYSYRPRYDYVFDIDFYWYKDGGYHVIDNPIDQTSKGKFTFQVTYANEDNKNNDIPQKPSTELSMKLYKSKTVITDTEWDDLILFSQTLIDELTHPSTDDNIWVDYRMCPTPGGDCCTAIEGPNTPPNNPWPAQCPTFTDSADCVLQTLPRGRPACEWVCLDAAGDIFNLLDFESNTDGTFTLSLSTSIIGLVASSGLCLVLIVITMFYIIKNCSKQQKIIT